MSTTRLSLSALIILAVLLSGCSFSTDLVVINLSDRAVEVRYRFRETPGPVKPPATPAIKTSAEMNDDAEWRKLSDADYVVDTHSHTVTLTLSPKTALLIAQVAGRGVSQAPEDAAYFPINEVVIRGPYGTMMLQGEQVRKSFASETDSAYSITYR
jgi:hypothetical protein